MADFSRLYFPQMAQLLGHFLRLFTRLHPDFIFNDATENVMVECFRYLWICVDFQKPHPLIKFVFIRYFVRSLQFILLGALHRHELLFRNK